MVSKITLGEIKNLIIIELLIFIMILSAYFYLKDSPLDTMSVKCDILVYKEVFSMDKSPDYIFKINTQFFILDYYMDKDYPRYFVKDGIGRMGYSDIYCKKSGEN